MEYNVEYKILGTIRIEADSQESANAIVADMEDNEMLEKSDSYMVTIMNDDITYL